MGWREAFGFVRKRHETGGPIKLTPIDLLGAIGRASLLRRGQFMHEVGGVTPYIVVKPSKVERERIFGDIAAADEVRRPEFLRALRKPCSSQRRAQLAELAAFLHLLESRSERRLVAAAIR